MDDEMRYHIECEAAERVRLGMTPGEAWRTSLRDFGGVDRHKEDARDVRGARILSDLARDVSYGARVLRRNPGFATAVVLTFALGIGCASSIFSFVDGVLLRPLPYADPATLVSVWERNEARNGGQNVVSVANFEAWRRAAPFFSDMAALAPAPLTLDGAPAERIKGVEVSSGYFRMLGVRPAMGRDFDLSEERGAAAPVAILSDGLWRRRFGADPNIVGRRISIDGRPITVIAVMGRDFDPPQFGWIADQPLWLPFAATPDRQAWGRFLHIVARLTPGMSVDRAQAGMLAISRRLEREIPNDRGWTSMVVSLSTTITGEVRRPLEVLFTAVVLLLLMSAVNVGNLVTTFARGRQHELDIRRAIGASASRIVRQQLVQSALLGALGTVVGLVFAAGGTRALVALAPASVPRLADIHMDARVVAVSCAVALLATLAFGAAGAFRAPRGSGAVAIVGVPTGRVTSRTSGSRLIAAEIAFGLVLTALAALMVRSMVKLRAVDLGFDAGSLVAARVSLPSVAYPDDERQRLFFAQVLERVRAVPGVSGASLVTSRPFACCAPATAVSDPSQPARVESAPVSDIRFADDSYFATARIPVVAGSVFSGAESPDGSPNVIVSRSLARALWGTTEPIGRTVSMALFGGITCRVIGVVGDVQLKDPHTRVRPSAYLSTERFGSSERDIVVRGTGDPRTLIAALRSAVSSLDRTIPLYSAARLDESVAETLAADRFTTVLLAAFALASLALASVGVYGVISAEVSRRRKEIGIRLAVGASAREVTALIIRRGLTPAVAGAAIGIAVALVVSRSMSALVFGVDTWDVLSFAIVAGTLLAVAMLATAIPALRAARLSPVEAIRAD